MCKLELLKTRTLPPTMRGTIKKIQQRKGQRVWGGDGGFGQGTMVRGHLNGNQMV